MITHNMLAGAIFRDDLLDAWCCGFCNSELSCRKCCDKMVTEYEDSIRSEAVRKFAEWLDNSEYSLVKFVNTWCGHYIGEKEAEADFYEALSEYEKEQKG